MPTSIFLNLPIKDLERSTAFFSALGCTFNPQFTDENATCMVISESIFAMLLVEPFYQTFTAKQIVDATTQSEALIGVSADSRQEVDDVVDKAIAAGAIVSREAQDYGFMYSRTFDDLDGHTWEFIWMDQEHVQ
jgi:predicted lactoylglutathione lyase